MTRPTPEQIKEARRLLSEPVEQWNNAGRNGLPVLSHHDMEALEILLAATEPHPEPTAEDIAKVYHRYWLTLYDAPHPLNRPWDEVDQWWKADEIRKAKEGLRNGLPTVYLILRDLLRAAGTPEGK